MMWVGVGARPFHVHSCRKKSLRFSSGASVISFYLISGIYFSIRVN